MLNTNPAYMALKLKMNFKVTQYNPFIESNNGLLRDIALL
jgi:hypothetical protein